LFFKLFYEEINISESELNELDHSGLINLLNKTNNTCFYLSNRKEETSNKPFLVSKNSIKTPENTKSFHLDFGNATEDKRKELKKKMEKISENHITKFSNPIKINLATQLLKKNDKIKEKSIRKSEGYSENLNLFSLQTNPNEQFSEYFTLNEKSRNELHFNNTIEKSFFKNTKTIDKKLKRKKTSRTPLEKNNKTFEISLSERKNSKEKMRKKSENFDFYQHLKMKKKEHERIFSARSYSKKDTSEEKITFDLTEYDGFYTARTLKGNSLDFTKKSHDFTKKGPMKSLNGKGH